jgi:hypothetical protein
MPHYRGSRRLARRAIAVAVLGMAAAGFTTFAPAAGAIGYQGITDQQIEIGRSVQTHTVTVGDKAEAWFLASPVDLCGTPLVGCTPGTTGLIPPFPAHTLHVGVLLGQEVARTYLMPDLTSLTADADAVQGTMSLPVDGALTDGTLMPETASIRACLATQRIPDGIEGSTANPPTIDCGTSAQVRYEAAKGGEFTIELKPFLAAWAAGKPAYGIALIPDTDVQPTELWQVALNGRKRAGGQHITTALTVEGTSAVPSASPTPTQSNTAPAAGAPALPTLPPALGVPGPVPSPVLAQPPENQVRAAYSGYQYPASFLIPLGLLCLATFLLRLFTRDLTPQRR